MTTKAGGVRTVMIAAVSAAPVIGAAAAAHGSGPQAADAAGTASGKAASFPAAEIAAGRARTGGEAVEPEARRDAEMRAKRSRASARNGRACR